MYVFFYGDWVVGVVFDCCVVVYDYVFVVGDVVDFGDYVCVWCVVVVYVVCGELWEFEEWCIWIE